MYVTTAAIHPQPATAAVPDPNNRQKGDKAIKCTGEKEGKILHALQTVSRNLPASLVLSNSLQVKSVAMTLRTAHTQSWGYEGDFAR